jgi:VIT1/CCC1 family predicted Fe2+/Mn2+ transporter
MLRLHVRQLLIQIKNRGAACALTHVNTGMQAPVKVWTMDSGSKRQGFRINRFSFGSAAGVVACVALVVGLGAAGAPKSVIVSSLLIVALADNLTDSLSIHIYQESERLPVREAFLATTSNFASRLVVSLSFILLVLALSIRGAVAAALAWGLFLLGLLSWIIARQRRVRPIPEVAKHLFVALVVIVLAELIGEWIPALIPTGP